MEVTVAAEYGYVLLVCFILYLNHNIFLVLPLLKARSKYGIKAPTLYPRDSQIKERKLSEDEVAHYMRCQRAHQNNVELMSHLFPLIIIVGLFAPLEVAIAGAWIAFWRIAYGFTYRNNAMRALPGLFHLGEMYILFWLLPKIAYTLITAA